jgi:hypothetical protein
MKNRRMALGMILEEEPKEAETSKKEIFLAVFDK